MLVTLSKEKRVGKVGFVVECGKAKIPVNVVNYTNDDKEDKGYEGRVRVLEAFEGIPVTLLKRRGSYTDKKENEQKFFTNFYLRCGTDFIAIEVDYLPVDAKKEDPNYGSNRRILSAFADLLPSKEEFVNMSIEDAEIPPQEPIKSEVKVVEGNGNIPF